MNNKKLIILGVVAVIMAAVAIAQSRFAKSPVNIITAGSYLVQGLEPDTIGSISVRANGSETTLVRDGSRFVVAQKGNYPALNSQVNKLVTGCLDIQTADVVSKDKANHSDLGVKEPNAQTIVTFYKNDKSVLAGVVLGNRVEASQSQYVRLLNDDQTFLSANAPMLQTASMDYVDKNLVRVDRGNLESMVIKSGDAKFTIKPAGSQAVITDGLVIPKGKKIKENAPDASFNALSDLNFEDVKPAAEMQKLDFNKTVTAYLNDSTVYTFQLADADGKSYVKCSAEFTDKEPVTKEQGVVEDAQQLKAKEAKLLARDKAAEFTNKHQGWVYEIVQWKAKNLVPATDDLLENEPNAPAPAADPNSKPADANAVK